MPNPFGDHLPRETGKKKPQVPAVQEETGFQAPVPIERVEIIGETELYKDLTHEQKQALIEWTKRQDLGMAVAQGPLICRENCAFKEVCPLYEQNLHPLGKRCPIEGSLMLRWKNKWAASLGMDLNDPDANDAFDLKLLDDLASISMLKQRALNEMALENPEIAEKVIAGYVEDMPMEKVILNPRVQLIERFAKLELKIYNELLSTRKAKFQVAGRLDDLSKRQAELQKKMREAREKEMAKAMSNGDVMEADYEVKE